MRLDKFLTETGVGTRSEVKKILKQKLVCVNGIVQTVAKVQIDEIQDTVTVNGVALTYERFCYYMLNKPKGVISATTDTKHRTVLDLLDDTARLKEVFPVGRLDKDTHGLLLLTNNGTLAHELLSPKKHVEKTYRAHIEGIMTEQDVETISQGILLENGERCLPAQLQIEHVNEDEQTSTVTLTIREGKYHQVKRMVAACGKKVIDLQRLTMGPIQIDPQLALGQFRRLTAAEEMLLKDYGVE